MYRPATGSESLRPAGGAAVVARVIAIAASPVEAMGRANPKANGAPKSVRAHRDDGIHLGRSARRNVARQRGDAQRARQRHADERELRRSASTPKSSAAEQMHEPVRADESGADAEPS